MIDRFQELEILVCQACESIYRKSYDNKLSEDEYRYFISSIAHNLITGICKDSEKKLRGEEE